MTITEKEFPITREVFDACGVTSEIGHLNAFTSEKFRAEKHIPFAIVRASDRGNLSIGQDIAHWMRQLRPQAFLLVGTAGGICRPENKEKTRWRGPARGDVAISEFIHYGDYKKVTSTRNQQRHHRLEQPSTYLLNQARAVTTEPASWHQWLGPTWSDSKQVPNAKEQEILVGEQIQDNPLDATQQQLMETFDRAGATEMESAGLANALHSLRRSATYAPMYLSIRGISDIIWARDLSGPLTPYDLELAISSDESALQGTGTTTPTAKTNERDSWSPRAAASAAAFALALTRRLVAQEVAAMPGHPLIEGADIQRVGSTV